MFHKFAFVFPSLISSDRIQKKLNYKPHQKYSNLVLRSDFPAYLVNLFFLIRGKYIKIEI
jgi:hypothetical protein